ncbi:unnamed protein product [Adineta steineri]|uniref:Uncharacterized protein n=1 Tax=Adineta steineri TaxID=433720 RepID=A0A814H7S8_9BILA|nr:unnamed protein product [Adineta steineri]CAF3759291.1 unnamed protein product [Adineta steineri]
MIPPDDNFNTDQAILDIDQIRILPMSHKYNPSRIHAGLLIYSVDGQTDFILNEIQLRIKTGDILIHQIPNALAGQEDVYRDLIRTLFGTHRINLVGLVFTFTGYGKFTDCMKWTPSSGDHTAPLHPTEQKLLEIVLVSHYMNNAWLVMQVASHMDVETLSQTAKKQYLLKLGEIEQLYNKQRQERERSPISKLLKFNHRHSSDNMRSFEWTTYRQETFDGAIQRLLDEFYNLILQVFQDNEFDRDHYAYFDDNTKQLFGALATPYARLPIQQTRPDYTYTPQPPYF